jgi:hypothetical protein
MIYLIALISLYLFWLIVIKPTLRAKKHIHIIEDQEILDSIIEESKLLKSTKIPTDDHILKYYKMYLKKDEIEKRDTWTTKQPMSFDEWKDRAKIPTKTEMISDNMGFQTNGGYQFMISMTCDMMVGMPPNHQYIRCYDYAAMVEQDELETKNG